ncbi:MAG: carotenoid biosynthesis protein [Bacteroidales bacterium]|nr:carotenoid biosynthesis protein [Bacteroidales bacterium]MDY0216358.1 carotenoid biosynthesis protein [Bacteroidales bacterium]
MNLYPKNKISVFEVKKFIIIFYIVGTLGFLIPFTKDFFIAITPFALILSTYLLALYHEKYTKKTIFVFLLIYLLGFLVELIGVNTGLIFGNYKYGSGLGLKIYETPLLIGINWLFLAYTSVSILSSYKLNSILTVIFAPFLMLIYDFVLEQVAPKMDMWDWQSSSVPISNYIAWYLIALVFAGFLKVFRINTENPMSKILLLSQFVFLFFLMLFFKIQA